MIWAGKLTPTTNGLPNMAERGGFEPPVGLTLHPLSKRARSTTLPPLQVLV
jgi:hypothetical protein